MCMLYAHTTLNAVTGMISDSNAAFRFTIALPNVSSSMPFVAVNTGQHSSTVLTAFIAACTGSVNHSETGVSWNTQTTTLSPSRHPRSNTPGWSRMQGLKWYSRTHTPSLTSAGAPSSDHHAHANTSGSQSACRRRSPSTGSTR